MCMENLSIKVRKEDRDYTVALKTVFKWNLTSENNLKNGKIELNFTRDEQTLNLEKIKVIEMDYQPFIISIIWTILPAIFAFAILTFELFLFIFNREALTAPIIFTFIGVVAVLLMGSVGLTYLRLKQLEKWLVNRVELLKEAKQKVDNLSK